MCAIPLPMGYCVDCNDGVLKAVIGKRDKARCTMHYWSGKRAQAAPINKKSETRNDEDEIYRTLKELFIKQNSICLANLSGCDHKACEVHHTKGHGLYYLMVRTWLPVCRICHQWLEVHVEEAIRLGLSQKRLTKEVIILPFKIRTEDTEKLFLKLTA